MCLSNLDQSLFIEISALERSKNIINCFKNKRASAINEFEHTIHEFPNSINHRPLVFADRDLNYCLNRLLNEFDRLSNSIRNRNALIDSDELDKRICRLCKAYDKLIYIGIMKHQ